MSTKRPLPGFGLLLAIVILAGGVLAMTAGAADPSSGSVSLDEQVSVWNGQQYANGVTSVPESNTARVACSVPTDDLCDHFDLTVDIDPSHWESSRGGVEVVISWASEDDDFDLYVFDAAGETVGSAAHAGTTSERVFIEDASGEYQVRVVPWDVTDSGYAGGARVESRALVGGEVPAEPLHGVECVDGLAGPFPCEGVDLQSFLPLDGIGGGQLNDIWGWTDPETGREYTLVGKTSGTAFVDVTDPLAPVYLGDLPSHQSVAGEPVETIFNVWRDIKVYEDHAYVVSEEPSHGMQVFDLTRLRGATEAQTWTEDANYSYVLDGTASVLDPSTNILNPPDNAHNLAINEESGFAYAIGTSTCGGGGPHMIDIRDPKSPAFAGCVSEDGYTHDTQCVNYEGPDERFAGREICFSSNEDTLTIVDVTDKEAPAQLSRTGYDTAAYTHQGWLTEDGRHFIVDDELDEQEQGGQTKTYVFDVEALDNPRLAAVHEGEAESIDHNLYVVGERVYQANYRSGLRILDSSRIADGVLEEVGFFDVYPPDDAPEFNGAWSNYPYFPSGNVVVSGIEQGLFVLRPQSAATGAAGDGLAGPVPGGGPPEGGSAGGPGASDGGAVPGGSQASPRCQAPPARARGRGMGGVRLGQPRSRVRRALGGGRPGRLVDRFCLTGGGSLRIGYPSRPALRGLPRAQRRRLRGDGALILSSSPRSSLRGVRVGARERALLRRVGRLSAVSVGQSVWYLRRAPRARLVFRVAGGRVRQVGVANLRLTDGRVRSARLLRAAR